MKNIYLEDALEYYESYSPQGPRENVNGASPLPSSEGGAHGAHNDTIPENHLILLGVPWQGKEKRYENIF